MAIFFWASIVASMVLYGNTLAAIKNIRDNKDTQTNLIVGCICIGIIIFTILVLSGR